MLSEIVLAVLIRTHQPQEITPAAARRYVRQLAAADGYQHEWSCIDELVRRESRWRWNADNPHSSAHGLFHLLRLRPNTPIGDQWERAKRYAEKRYAGAFCNALEHHNRAGWW